MWTRILSTTAVLAVAGLAAEGPETIGQHAMRPPVLRGSEPTDSGIVMLPTPVAPPAPRVEAPAPAPQTELETPPPPKTSRPKDPPPAIIPVAVAPRPAMPVPSAVTASIAVIAPAAVIPPALAATKAPKSIQAPAIPNTPPATSSAPARKSYLPADFERDIASYSQKRIGEWTEPDVYNLFGDPLRQRSAPNDGKKEDSGRILAFADPTGRYREIELDFAPGTGLLRSVFVYPWQMTWQECRRLWDGEVSSTKANKGRVFYSYLNRRLDVLVDPAGKVVSFGLY